MTDLSAIDRNYRDIGDTDLDVITDALRTVDSPMLATAAETHEAASPLNALFWAMAWMENQFETTGKIIRPADHNPVSLRPWIGDPEGHNVWVIDWDTRRTTGDAVQASPHAIGAIRASDGSYMLRFASDAACAREWRRRMTDPAYKNGVYTSAHTLREMTDIYCPPGDVHPETGVRNEDIPYAETVTYKLRQFAAKETPMAALVQDLATALANIPVINPVTGPTVKMKSYRFPGAPRELYLPDWDDVEVAVRIATSPRVTSQRVTPPKTSSTGHDTSNPRTNALGELSWLLDGRPGGEKGGYTTINDDRHLFITSWLNWETWHAGTALGNWTSWGSELAYGGNVNWIKALEVYAAWHGGVLEMGDLDPSDDFVWHQHWYGKYCPRQIFQRGQAAEVRAMIVKAFNLARAYRGGIIIDVPSTTYVHPVPVRDSAGVLWDGTSDVVVNGNKYEAQRVTAKTTVTLNQRQWAGTQSMLTNPALPAGTEVELLGWVAGELVDGISEWWIDTRGNRLWAGGIDATPKQDPEYGQLPETAPGTISVNGRLYYPLYERDTEAGDVDNKTLIDNGGIGRKITVTRAGDLHRWAGTDSAVVGHVTPGTADDPVEVVCTYWTRGEELPLSDGAMEPIWYVVKPDGDDAESLDGPRLWAGLTGERPQ